MRIKPTSILIKILTKAKILSVFTAILFISGCAGMNSHFDCNVNSGGKCAPMHSIHRMADSGMFNERGMHPKPINIAMTKPSALNGYLENSEGKPIRSTETIQQIWIGSYEDANGNYHEPSSLYAVVKKGRWISEEKEVIQD